MVKKEVCYLKVVQIFIVNIQAVPAERFRITGTEGENPGQYRFSGMCASHTPIQWALVILSPE
jgi:hypothetical protein